MVIIGMLGIALFVLALILAGFTWWIIRYVLVELPKRQQDILDRFSPCVVNEVMLEYASLPEYQQKQIACEKMRDIFNDEDIAPPGDAMIEAAVADAMYRKKVREADIWIEELKKDNLIETNTIEMPVTPKEDMWVL